MPELVRQVAKQRGDSTLAVLGESRLTYRQADEQSAALARGLVATGVGKGTAVGLLAPNGPEWIIGWLAACRIGARAFLLNTYHQARELGWALRHGDIAVLLTADRYLGHDYLDRLEQLAPGLPDQAHPRLLVESHPNLRTVWVWGEADRTWAGATAELVAAGADVSLELLHALEDDVDPADPAVVIYSSGSTAEPKGAVHRHGPLVRHAHNLWPFRELDADDVIYTPMPLFWVGGLSYVLVAAMHAGASLVFEEAFDPGVTLELLERERVTSVLSWPHAIKELLEHPSYGDRDLSAIRHAGHPDLMPADRRPADPGLRATSLGMTETLGPHLIDDPTVDLPESKRGSFGRSVPGVEHRVVDPVTRDPLRPGEVGELQVRGYSLTADLHKRERENVFDPDGWYSTGDGGHFDGDGHFYFRGRLGTQIKSAGMNITPREVELVLEAQPEVMHAFVYGVPAGDRGEDVAAAVVLRPDMEVGADELAGRVKGEVATYKVPRHLALFAVADDLPWLESGKIDGRAVQALLTERFGPPH